MFEHLLSVVPSNLHVAMNKDEESERFEEDKTKALIQKQADKPRRYASLKL